MKAYDLVPFFNEVDILRARIALLDGHVDRHIVMEALQTHQGDPKPLHLDGVDLPTHVHRFTADLSGGEGDKANWRRERQQRDALSPAATAAGVVPGDLVLSCDVDELVNPAALPAIIEATERGPVRLGMRMLYYGFDWENPAGWAHPMAFRWGSQGHALSAWRTHGKYPVLPGCGWHVSYWGGVQRRRTKVEAFAHRENRAPDVWARIETGDETGIGPNGEKLTRVDPATIPDALREALSERVG